MNTEAVLKDFIHRGNTLFTRIGDKYIPVKDIRAKGLILEEGSIIPHYSYLNLFIKTKQGYRDLVNKPLKYIQDTIPILEQSLFSRPLIPGDIIYDGETIITILYYGDSEYTGEDDIEPMYICIAELKEGTLEYHDLIQLQKQGFKLIEIITN